MLRQFLVSGRGSQWDQRILSGSGSDGQLHRRTARTFATTFVYHSIIRGNSGKGIVNAKSTVIRTAIQKYDQIARTEEVKHEREEDDGLNAQASHGGGNNESAGTSPTHGGLKDGLEKRPGRASEDRMMVGCEGAVSGDGRNLGRTAAAARCVRGLRRGLHSGRVGRREEQPAQGLHFIRDPDSDVKGGVKWSKSVRAGCEARDRLRCRFTSAAAAFSHTRTHISLRIALGITNRHEGIRVGGFELVYGNVHVSFSRVRPSVPSSTTPTLW